ncbi:MAG TPA: bifunctional homocysteine S-methyltransferase/methylenetetrahydrofolate reductase [Anaerolineaceae bacterium]|nr:bifunctional homocysteine S-methyltransferase/methylenetetrahydrofolate reductase [Anaerolineaceae bacterium]
MGNLTLSALFESGKPVLADGAMGTTLHQRGVSFDQCFDELNLTNPGLVGEIHREYIQSGVQILKTNTFGANRYKLARHGLEAQVLDINRAGVDLARRVVLASFRDILIAGDVGPLGVRLAPFGRVQTDQACQAFEEQIGALKDAGADLILVETMTDLYEIREAVNAARHVAPELPIIASMTFTRDDRTLLGDSPEKVAAALWNDRVDVIGVNCSGGPAQLLRILKLMHAAVPQARFSVMPNAGWPEQVGGRIMYPAVPQYFGDYARLFWSAGAGIIGGCCGTTPEHIHSMRQAIDTAPAELAANGNSQPTAEPEEAQLTPEQPTQLAHRLASGRFVIAVEMDPPRGVAIKKVLAGASLLAEVGADVIDVADSPMARMRMSPWAICNLVQRQIGLETVLHFPTRGRNLLRVQGDLLAAHALGVRNVFVVMGDPTAVGDYPDAMDNYDLVPSGLIKLIKQNFNAGVDHAGSDIGQPTSFFVGCALNLNPPDPQAEIKNLRRKLHAQADFILTQPIYEIGPARAFLQRFQDDYGPLPVPVIAGVLPLMNPRHAAFLHHEVPGMFIPEEIRRRMEASGENSVLVGREIAIELIVEIRSLFNGIYLMPAFNRFDNIAEIIDAVRQLEKTG